MGLSTALKNPAGGDPGHHRGQGRAYENQPLSPSQVLAQVRQSCSSSHLAAESLKRQLSAASVTSPTLKEHAAEVSRFIDASQQLSYDSYRSVIGLVARCREDKSGQGLEALITNRGGILDKSPPQVRGLFETLSPIVSQLQAEAIRNLPLKDNHLAFDAKFYGDLAENLMLTLRTVHPLGVNIANPTMRPEDGPWGYPAGKRLCLLLMSGEELRLDSGTLEIRPAHDRDGVEVQFLNQGEKWDRSRPFTNVRPGESVVIGRPLRVPTRTDEPNDLRLFGVPIAERVEVPVGVTIDSVSWSRGGLMISLSKDGTTVMIFDRGMKAPVGRPDEVEGVHTYVPRTVISPDGEVSYGHSEVRPRKRV